MIDVNEYQEMCFKCSLVKKIPDELKVIHKGIVYFPVGFEKRFKNGKGYRSAIVRDLKANSEYIVDFESLEKYQGRELNV